MDKSSGLPSIPIPNLNDESWFSTTPAPNKEAEILDQTPDKNPTHVYHPSQHLDPQE
jgi:hypothetical protein